MPKAICAFVAVADALVRVIFQFLKICVLSQEDISIPL